MTRPLLVVISGPSGAGKDSVADRLLESLPGLHRVVTMTTRPPRPGEVDGRDYHFVSEDEFRALLDADGFVEHATVYDRHYGVPRREIDESLASGRDTLARVDVQGAATLRRLYPDALLIFIEPPSLDESNRRVEERDGDTEASRAVRRETATQEMEAAKAFDHRVVNQTGRLEETALRVTEIIAAEKRKRAGS
ncbi:MAG TPA: guanylate kinase [Dehalococcoidia bacterium]|nr:guanylate kinase [Dehalococcoidia bacterium]